MPSQILQNYLNDNSIERSKRERMFKILQESPQDEAQLEQIIQQKYKGKYGQATSSQSTAPTKSKMDFSDPAEAGFQALESSGPLGSIAAKLGRKGRDAKDMSVGATTKGFEILGNVGKFGASSIPTPADPFIKMFAPKGTPTPGEAVGQTFESFADRQAQDMRDNLYSPKAKRGESTHANIGEGLANIASLVPSIMGGAAITQNIASAPSKLQGMLGAFGGGRALTAPQVISPNILNPLAFVGGGAGVTTGAGITGEGRLPTAKEYTTGAAIDLATLGGGKLFSGLGKRLFSRLVPTSPTQRAKDMKLGFDLGDEMSKVAPITANEQTVVRAAQKRVGELSDELLDQVRNSDTGQKYVIDDFLDGIKEKVIRSKNLKSTPRQAQLVDKQLEKAISGTKEALGGKQFSLEELHRFKQDLGSDLAKSIDKLVRDGADASITAPKIFDLELQKSIKNTLENNVSRYKSLNKKMSPLIASYKRISSKAPRPSFWNNMLSSAGTGTIATLASGGDVETGLKAAILGAALPSIAGSPLTKTLGGRTATMTGEALQSPVLRGLTRGLMFGEEQAN